MIIDSDAGIAGPINEPLDKMGIEVFSASDLQTALYRYNKQFFRVVFVQLNFDELDGLSLIQKFRCHQIDEKRRAGFVIMNSSPISDEKMALCNELGRMQMVSKPLSIGPLISQIQKAYQTHVKLELTYKIKKEIVDRMEADNDVREAIKSAHDFKKPLGDEYIPLVLDLYGQCGDYEEGLNLLKQMPDNTMEPLQKLNLMGQFNLKMGNFAEARKSFEEADAIAPKNIERISSMIDLYLEMKAPEMAVEKQKEVLDMNPDQPDMKFDMFQRLDEAGFSDEAVDFCQDTTGPREVVKFYNNKGVVMAKTASLDDAVKEYERALLYYPNNKNNYQIHYNIGLAYARMKKSTKIQLAIEHLELCLQQKDDFEKAKTLLDRIGHLKKTA